MPGRIGGAKGLAEQRGRGTLPAVWWLEVGAGHTYYLSPCSLEALWLVPRLSSGVLLQHP